MGEGKFLKKVSFPHTPILLKTELGGFLLNVKLTAARVILSGAQRSRTAKQHRAKRGGISGENTLKFHYRSRFAPSLGSGSTTTISHREIFSAQDDTRYVNISGRGELRSPAGTGENVDF